MSNVLLGIIAVAVVVMTVLQIVAAVLAARAVRRVDDLVTRFDRDIRPIVDNLRQLTTDAARATALAAAQVERADRMFGDITMRIQQALSTLPNLLESVRDGFNLLGAIKSILNTFRDSGRQGAKRGVGVEEDDPLFIG